MQVPSMRCYVWHGWMTYSTSGGWSHWDDHWTISHYISYGQYSWLITIIRILIMDGMTINHIVSIDHGSYTSRSSNVWTMAYVTNPLFLMFLKLDRASLGRQGASPESDTPRTPSWRHFPPSIWRSLCSVRCWGQDRLISEEWCRMVKMWNVKMMTLRVYGGWNYSSWGCEKKTLVTVGPHLVC